MYNKEENVLIKSHNAYMGYWVAHKASRTITLFNNVTVAANAINKLLEDDAEVYESDNEFYKKYPPLTLEDRKRMTEEWLKKSPDDHK